ncbi:hypothetical protein AGMMS49928_22860 [Spirochaetia bacterium]|nr:hypothetical protein AGMMS49928_22860 [Spirochaetia bacterium]
MEKRTHSRSKNKMFLCGIIALVAVIGFSGCDNPAGGGPGGGPATVNIFDLTGKITAPVRWVWPVTTFTETAQYTGTVVWQTGTGTSLKGTFAASTIYKAVVTLKTKTGYTFSGVAANSFTYTGATAVNAANSGIVTITFPATAAEPPGNADLTITFNQIADAAPVITEPIIRLTGTPKTVTLTVTNSGQYTSIAWRVDNQNTSETGSSFILDASNTAYNKVGVHYVSVEVVKSGVPYNKTVLFTVEK